MLQRWGAGRGSSEKLQLQPATQRLRMLWQRLRGAVQWRPTGGAADGYLQAAAGGWEGTEAGRRRG